jgi:hypothetical protein
MTTTDPSGEGGRNDNGERKYKHIPLEYDNSIRLLRLEPSTCSDSRLCGSLIEFHLEKKPIYEAVSYTWSKPVFPERLNLDDGSLQITENVAWALKRFRLTDNSRLLWIDSVCINQDDDKEKGQQVSLMADIFMQASQVLVWLGLATCNTEPALRYMENLASSAERFGIDGAADNKMWNDPFVKANHEDIPQLLEDTRRHKLHDIYGRAWFTRLWIVQEVALATNILICCGSNELDWSVFTTAITLLEAAAKSARKQAADLQSFERAWNIIKIRGSYRMGQLVFFTSPYDEFRQFMSKIIHQDCKDDRDRVYGLLGLSLSRMRQARFALGTTSLIGFDYTKTAAGVYTSLARHFLSQHDRDSSRYWLMAEVQARRAEFLQRNVLDSAGSGFRLLAVMGSRFSTSKHAATRSLEQHVILRRGEMEFR